MLIASQHKVDYIVFKSTSTRLEFRCRNTGTLTKPAGLADSTRFFTCGSKIVYNFKRDGATSKRFIKNEKQVVEEHTCLSEEAVLRRRAELRKRAEESLADASRLAAVGAGDAAQTPTARRKRSRTERMSLISTDELHRQAVADGFVVQQRYGKSSRAAATVTRQTLSKQLSEKYYGGKMIRPSTMTATIGKIRSTTSGDHVAHVARATAFAAEMRNAYDGYCHVHKNTSRELQSLIWIHPAVKFFAGVCIPLLSVDATFPRLNGVKIGTYFIACVHVPFPLQPSTNLRSSRTWLPIALMYDAAAETSDAYVRMLDHLYGAGLFERWPSSQQSPVMSEDEWNRRGRAWSVISDGFAGLDARLSTWATSRSVTLYNYRCVVHLARNAVDMWTQMYPALKENVNAKTLYTPMRSFAAIRHRNQLDNALNTAIASNEVEDRPRRAAALYLKSNNDSHPREQWSAAYAPSARYGVYSTNGSEQFNAMFADARQDFLLLAFQYFVKRTMMQYQRLRNIVFFDPTAACESAAIVDMAAGATAAEIELRKQIQTHAMYFQRPLLQIGVIGRESADAQSTAHEWRVRVGSTASEQIVTRNTQTVVVNTASGTCSCKRPFVDGVICAHVWAVVESIDAGGTSRTAVLSRFAPRGTLRSETSTMFEQTFDLPLAMTPWFLLQSDNTRPRPPPAMSGRPRRQQSGEERRRRVRSDVARRRSVGEGARCSNCLRRDGHNKRTCTNPTAPQRNNDS